MGVDPRPGDGRRRAAEHRRPPNVRAQALPQYRSHPLTTNSTNLGIGPFSNKRPDGSPMRKSDLLVAFPLAGLVVFTSACGSSSPPPPTNPSSRVRSSASPTVTAAAADADPTVGPTNAAASPNPQPAAVDLQV